LGLFDLDRKEGKTRKEKDPKIRETWGVGLMELTGFDPTTS